MLVTVHAATTNYTIVKFKRFYRETPRERQKRYRYTEHLTADRGVLSGTLKPLERPYNVMYIEFINEVRLYPLQPCIFPQMNDFRSSYAVVFMGRHEEP